jgi:hypothetical protein
MLPRTQILLAVCIAIFLYVLFVSFSDNKFISVTSEREESSAAKKKANEMYETNKQTQANTLEEEMIQRVTPLTTNIKHSTNVKPVWNSSIQSSDL